MYKEARARGAPPLDRLPSRVFVMVVAAGIGAARGLGFALVRPALPKRPETAALVYSSLGAAMAVTGLLKLDRLLAQNRPDRLTMPPAHRLARTWISRVIFRAAVNAAIERTLTRSKLGGHT